MLGFREYRNRFTEADAASPAAVTPDDVLKHANLEKLKNDINKEVDSWVADLKRTLVNPFTPLNRQRGMWDRFKNSVSNLWHGRYNQSNPYFWQNKLGDDLGATAESFVQMPFSLEEYKELRSICESLEEEIMEADGTENLKVMRIIDMKAQELKTKLLNMLSSTVGSEAPASPVAPESPASPAAPGPGEEKPADPAAAEEDEEPDTPARGAVPLLKQLLQQAHDNGELKGVISDADYQSLMDDIESSKQSVRDKAHDKAQWALNNRKSPKAKNDVLPPPTSGEDGDHEQQATSPPTTGKAWNELSDAEQQAWNRYGGGLEDSPGKIDGCLNDHGIKKLPWILRIGDPRREILARQERGELGRGDGKCSRKHSHWYRMFMLHKRFEDTDNPVKSWADLHARVEKIKEVVKIARDNFVKSSRRTTKISDEELARMGERGATDAPGKPADSPLPPPAATAPPVEKPDLRTRNAPIDPAEVGDRVAHTPDNALGEPAHRTAPIPGAAPPPKEDEEAPAKDPRKMKAELKERIAKIEDEDQREQFARHLKKAKSLEALEELERDVTQFEKYHTGGLDFSWTIHDLNGYYKKKLVERKEPPKTLVDRQKVEVLSFNERVEYYKELAKQRN